MFRLEACDLSDWAIGRANLPTLSLHECRLTNVNMPWLVGPRSLTACSIEGVFNATLSGRFEVAGNNFEKAVGVRFADGVPLDANTFAIDGTQIIIRRDHPSWRRVLDRAAQGDATAVDLRIKCSGRQSWQVLYRAQTNDEDWRFYAELFGGLPFETSSSLPTLLEESLGQGVVHFLGADSDSEAWRRAHLTATGPSLDVQLTPSGLRSLAELLKLDQGTAIAIVREDHDRMVLRLHPDFTQALRSVTQRSELLASWQLALGQALQPEWADDPQAVLDALLATATTTKQGEFLYAVMLP